MGAATTSVDFGYGFHGITLARRNRLNLVARERRASINFLFCVSQLVDLSRYRRSLGFGDPLLIDPIIIPLSEAATGSTIDLSQFADVHGDAGAFIELLIVALIFGGVVEEICFRGFFIGWGVSLYGRRAALPLVLVTSVAFGIGHWYQGPAGAIVTGTSSIVFGLVYIMTGYKLLPAVATHMSVNFLGVLDLYLHGP